MFARARRVALDKLAVAKEEFSRLLDMNIVRPSSNSPRSSPLHMVSKPYPVVGEAVVITGRLMQFQKMTDIQYLTCNILQRTL